MRGVGGVDGDVMRHSYKWAIKLSPRWVDGYYNLGNLLLATNQVEKAMERLQVAGVCRPVCPPVCSVCAAAVLVTDSRMTRRPGPLQRRTPRRRRQARWTCEASARFKRPR